MLLDFYHFSIEKFFAYTKEQKLYAARSKEIAIIIVIPSYDTISGPGLIINFLQKLQNDFFLKMGKVEKDLKHQAQQFLK